MSASVSAVKGDAGVSPRDSEADELAQIFLERARLLSQSKEEKTDSSGSEVFRFEVGRVRFAIELAMVRSIFVPRSVVEIPGAPPHMKEIAHVSGRMVSLLHLDLLMGTASSANVQHKYVLIEHNQKRVAVAAASLQGISDLDLSSLSPAAQATGSDLLLGVANDMTLVLDGARVVSNLRVDMSHTD